MFTGGAHTLLLPSLFLSLFPRPFPPPWSSSEESTLLSARRQDSGPTPAVTPPIILRLQCWTHTGKRRELTEELEYFSNETKSIQPPLPICVRLHPSISPLFPPLSSRRRNMMPSAVEEQISGKMIQSESCPHFHQGPKYN